MQVKCKNSIDSQFYKLHCCFWLLTSTIFRPPNTFGKYLIWLLPIQILFMPMIFFASRFHCGMIHQNWTAIHWEFLLKLHVSAFSGIRIGKSACSAFCTFWPVGVLLVVTSWVLFLTAASVQCFMQCLVVSSRMVYPSRLAATECQTVSQAVAECFLYISVFFQEGRCKGTRWLFPPPLFTRYV